ncbi:TetR/AcrR family transcriptional regulator [Actinomadura roseirufa]|uniref:TetR/AcrR family transcriptional regulator n=1 Tax=Actinomadura roseirufa TaxID=2094049 RepID=UPI0010417327|nr:TetR/AcrR family transcriptional regulator [Actinomadura roseirufa]
MRRSAAETRAHVLAVAGQLFYRNGVRATGIDLVAAEAGVAPTTLYRLFASKEGLVGAYVERADHDFRAVLADAVEAAGPDPREQILAVFDAYGRQIRSERFRGCPMMMTLAEFPDPGGREHRGAVDGKSWLRATLGRLTARLGAGDPAGLADHLTLVVEGMLASAQALGPDGPSARGRELAEMVLAAAAPRRDRL